MALGLRTNCATCAEGDSGTPPDDWSPDPCQATSSSDDGLDGNFYCINGGEVGGITGSCTCTNCDNGYGGENCQNIEHSVDSMTKLFNKVSNGNGSSENTGNAIMTNGDTTVMAVGNYKCSEGTCASEYNMLYLEDLSGELKCEDDNANCILDGEGTQRGMIVNEASTGGSVILTIRALTFHDCLARGGMMYDMGGAVAIMADNAQTSVAMVDFCFCVFSNCGSLQWNAGGGAIALLSGFVNIYGSRFTGNTAVTGVAGKDIYRNAGTIKIHNTCPSPYASNTPNKGKSVSSDDQPEDYTRFKPF